MPIFQIVPHQSGSEPVGLHIHEHFLILLPAPTEGGVGGVADGWMSSHVSHSSEVDTNCIERCFSSPIEISGLAQ